MTTRPDDIPKPSKSARPNAAHIASWLRERIRKGRLVPGQRLVEIDIIQETGGSRSKVREALQRLEAEGLVTIEEFRGASVRNASVEEIRQIYRARVALEGISAADFAETGTDKEKQKLADLQKQLDDSVTAHAPERFAQLNAQWHEQVVAGTGNTLIADTLNRLNVPINRLLFESFYDEERLKNANQDHKAITDAILSGDSQRAEQLMRTHIEDGLIAFTRIASEFSSLSESIDSDIKKIN
ncbi:MAG: GntR family transcriptional regulator [Sphingomonadaceae bacterium]